MITPITPAMEENDLHIAKHISPESLPAIIRPILSLAQSPAEKDMLLLSLLTASGSCMPNRVSSCSPTRSANGSVSTLSPPIRHSSACSARIFTRWC